LSKVVIFTAPSGAGKTTLVRHLLSQLKQLMFSVSATTRNKRSFEINGHDYYFLTTDEFEAKVRDEEFLEYEEVYRGFYYGTLKSEIERIWGLNKVVIFDVDVKGALAIKNHYGDDALAVFVKPPTLEILKQRLIDRSTETPESLAIRLKRVELEMTYEQLFDAVVVNDVLEDAKKEALKVVSDFINA